MLLYRKMFWIESEIYEQNKRSLFCLQRGRQILKTIKLYL